MEPDPGSLAGYFDHWYADMTISPVKDEIHQRHLGLPPRLLEPRKPGDERLPARLRQVDLGAGLTGAGFAEVEVRDRPLWRDRERAMWAEAAALDPGEDPALISFHDEGLRAPLLFELTRRVMATATAP
jgi:hypothetical protein